MHGRTPDPESCFSRCNVFFTLKSCDVRGCNFITNTKEKLGRHSPDHHELEDDPPLVRSVMLGQLSQELQVKVVEEHRRNMGKQSAKNKTVESEGLLSPPLELIRPNLRAESRADQPSEPSSPPKIAGFGRGKIRLVDEDEVDGQQLEVRRRRGAMMTRFPYEERDQPVASHTRQRARGRAVSNGNDHSAMRRERARVIQEELTKAMSDLPFPQRTTCTASHGESGQGTLTGALHRRDHWRKENLLHVLLRADLAVRRYSDLTSAEEQHRDWVRDQLSYRHPRHVLRRPTRAVSLGHQRTNVRHLHTP